MFSCSSPWLPSVQFWLVWSSPNQRVNPGSFHSLFWPFYRHLYSDWAEFVTLYQLISMYCFALVPLKMNKLRKKTHRWVHDKEKQEATSDTMIKIIDRGYYQGHTRSGMATGRRGGHGFILMIPFGRFLHFRFTVRRFGRQIETVSRWQRVCR